MGQPPSESRQRTLEAALRLFGERGYGDTALQAIADELGVTKASVYYYFPSKADLLEALAEPLLVRLEAIVAQAPDTSDLANCRALLEDYLVALIKWRVVAGLLMGDPTVATHRPALRCRVQRGLVRDLLARAGSPPVGTVLATCALGAVQSPVFESPYAGEADVEAILDAAVRALGGDRRQQR